jgi:hypothetical protein
MISALDRPTVRLSRRLILCAVSLVLAVGARAASLGDAAVSDAGAGSSSADIVTAAASGGAETVVTGNGVGSGAPIDTPAYVTVSPNGTTYYYETLASSSQNCIIGISPGSSVRTIVSGAGIGSGTAFVAVSGMAWDVATGSLIVSDSGSSSSNSRIVSVDVTTGNRSVITGSGVGSGVILSNPEFVAVAGSGTIYYFEADLTLALGNSVVSVNPTTGVRTLVSNGITSVGTGPSFVLATGMAWDFSTNTLVVSDAGTSSANAGIIRVAPATGNRTFVTGNGVGSGAALDVPEFVAVNASGTIFYVEDDAVGTANEVIAVNSGVRSALAAFTAPTWVTAEGLAPKISNSVLTASGSVGVLFSAYTVTALNSPTTYGATGLPTGLSINPGSGAIAGIPTQAGIFNVSISAINAFGPGSATLVLTIGAPTVTLTPALLPAGMVGAGYGVALSASGGTSPYLYAIVSGGLPPGIAFSGGVFSGAPTAAGLYPVTIKATDSSTGLAAPFTGTHSYSILVNPAPAAVTLTGASLTYTGSPIALTATSVPTVAGFIYSYVGTGGTTYGPTPTAPTNAGTYSVTATVNDANYTGLASAVLTIVPASQTITFPPIGVVPVGVPVSLTASASSGLPVSFAIQSGNATISGGNSLTIADLNPVIVVATQTGGGNYLAATPVSQTVTAVATGPSPAAVTLTPASRAYTGSPIGLTATSTPTVAGFVYSYAGTGATTYGPTATPPTNTGTYVVTATVNDPSFTGQAAAALTITPAAQTIMFPPAGAIMEASVHPLVASSTSGLAVTFSIQSGAATLIGGTSIRITNLLPVVIVASQSGNANYSAATPVSQTVTATRASTLPQVIATSSTPSAAALAAATPLLVTSAAQTVAAGSSPTLTVATAGTVQWMFNGSNLPGATGATLTLANIGATQTGSYSAVVTNADGSLGVGTASIVVTVDASLNDLSARAFVGAGANQGLSMGFITSGPSSGPLLIQGVGPALSQFGVTGPLASPQLALVDATGSLIASDLGWGNAPVLGASPVSAAVQAATSALFAQLEGIPLSVGSSDSALVASLPAGQYTAEITGANQATGTALAGLSGASGASPVINLSARATVNPGAGALVAGFVVSGTTSETILIRGVGPGLGSFGISGPLAAPVLTLFDHAGNVIASNTGWSNASALGASTVPAGVQPATVSAMSNVSAFSLPAGSADSAMVVTLPPGVYTAQVSGAGGSTGVGLIELYVVPTAP